MQRLEVSVAVRPLQVSLGFKGLISLMGKDHLQDRATDERKIIKVYLKQIVDTSEVLQTQHFNTSFVFSTI